MNQNLNNTGKDHSTGDAQVGGFWTPGRILALLVLAALAIRLAAASTRAMVQLDETAYVSMAESLSAGRGPVDITGVTQTYFSPLLPLLIAGLATVVRNHVVAAHIIVAVFGSLMLVPAYLLGREFVGERAGLMAAALFAVMPIFVTYSSLVYTEVVYTFFLLMAIYFGWHMLKGRRLTCGAAAGLSLGLAYLSNPAAVFYLAALLGLAALMAIVKGGWPRMARSAGVFLLAFLVFAVPYVVFLHSELGRWTYTGKYVDVNVYTATHGLRLGTLEWEEDMLSLTDDQSEVKVGALPGNIDLLDFILGNPKVAARIFAEQSYHLYSNLLPQFLPLWLLPLLGLGLFAGAWNRGRATQVGYLLLMISPALLILAMYAHDRFFIPYVAITTIWIAAGWQKLEQWAFRTETLSLAEPRPGWLGRATPWAVGVAVLVPMLLFSAFLVQRWSEETQYKEAGLWLGENAGAGQRIVNRESPSAYYAGGTPIFLPYADYEGLNAYARNKDVDYMVVGSQVIRDWRPGLTVLLEEQENHPEWRLAHVVRPGTASETLIFEFTGK